MYELYNEDCLQGMKRIADGTVDCILSDLPYQITDCAFDVRIPFEPMWEQFKRVTKRNAAIVLFANGKFLIELAASNLKDYRYKWVWHKNLGTGFLNAKKMPLKCHEDILIFYQQLPTYNPQFSEGKPYKFTHPTGSENYQCKYGEVVRESDGRRYPIDEINFMQVTNFSAETCYHPQQKPVALLEYLIKTYTNAGELVLDATMGSGSTGVACANTGRRFIGFETETKFYDIAKKRIDEALAKKAQELF